MSITTYSELKTALDNWLNRSDLTSRIPEFIALCEAQLNRDLMLMEPPHKVLEQSTTGTLASTIALPTGYIGTKSFKITTSGDERPLTYITPTQAAKYGTTGRSDYYTITGGNLVPLMPPGTAEAYTWVYYKRLTAFSGASDTNDILTYSPDLYLYGSLVHAEPYLANDARIATWKAMYANALQSEEMLNTKERQSGSTLRMRSDAAI